MVPNVGLSDDPEETKYDEVRIPVLQPLSSSQVVRHSTIFINEVLLSDFKQVINGVQRDVTNSCFNFKDC
ncbi:hypothetical protein TNCV_2826911 [Trichonephila clavipes]|nr:hypothetical protein TNCV_2826911 [Trichonephila clavipes]